MSADRFMILASDEQGGSVAIGPITGYTEALDARDELDRKALAADGDALKWEFGAVCRVMSPAQVRKDWTK